MHVDGNLLYFLGKRIWDFSRFTSDCTFGHHKSFSGGASSFEKDDIVNSCSQMVLQLHNVYDPEKVRRINLFFFFFFSSNVFFSC